MKNTAESLRVGKLVGASVGRCYWNAFWTILDVPGYELADYVEGILVLDNGLYLEHGWVERAGEIVDPTLPGQGGAYFPGLRFGGRPGLAAAFKLRKPSGTEDLPFFYRFGWAGANSPEFCRAREEASATSESGAHFGIRRGAFPGKLPAPSKRKSPSTKGVDRDKDCGCTNRCT